MLKVCRIMANESIPPSFANAVVTIANYYQFAHGQRLSQPCVQSRMLLWVKAGKGAVRVNQETCPVALDDFLWMPWNRHITYMADSGEPMLVGGIHIIPDHSRAQPVVYEIAHREHDALRDCSWRKDVAFEGLEALKRGSLAQAPALKHLVEFTAQRYITGSRHEWEFRSLAQLLLGALTDHFNASASPPANVPAEMEMMIQFVRSHQNQKLSLEHVAKFAERSPSAVGRMFQKHLGMTTVEFIAQTKMKTAQQLLSTSRLSVGEIGRRVGIEDPYYFSKLFRKTVGCSPLEHRKKSSLL